MPRGVPVNWTQEDLERMQTVSGANNVEALAKAFGVAPNTIYSVKSRLNHETIEEILLKQSRRRTAAYTRGGGASAPATVEQQLARVYLITVGNAGRGGAYPQFNVTIPARIGEAWVERWGQQIRFRPTDEGLLIVPVKPEPPPPLPSWLNGTSGEQP